GSGPELVAAVVDDATRGGGTVVAGQRPSEWLVALVEQGAMPIDLAVGLVAAMLQSHRDAASICEAAALAAALRRSELAELLVLSIEALDVGLLLETAPHGQGASV